MKALMVMFDSLNRRMLSPDGCDWVHTPSFQRLAERCVTFENCYVDIVPCIPGLLKQQGVYTHLVSDHYHVDPTLAPVRTELARRRQQFMMGAGEPIPEYYQRRTIDRRSASRQQIL